MEKERVIQMTEARIQNLLMRLKELAGVRIVSVGIGTNEDGIITVTIETEDIEAE